MSKNILFNYLYRDASNYKSWGEVIFANPDNLTLIEIENRLRKSFDYEMHFIADQINVGTLFFEDITDDDHCYHEFYSCEFSENALSDPLNRTIKLFIEQVEGESLHGWRLFDPMEREMTRFYNH